VPYYGVTWRIEALGLGQSNGLCRKKMGVKDLTRQSEKEKRKRKKKKVQIDLKLKLKSKCTEMINSLHFSS